MRITSYLLTDRVTVSEGMTLEHHKSDDGSFLCLQDHRPSLECTPLASAPAFAREGEVNRKQRGNHVGLAQRHTVSK